MVHNINTIIILSFITQITIVEINVILYPKRKQNKNPTKADKFSYLLDS